MNLRDKLRAVGGTDGKKKAEAASRTEDCLHYLSVRPAEEFPGAPSLRGETLRLMSDKLLPDPFDPEKILYLDTETTGLGGSGTVAFLVGLGYWREGRFEVHQYLIRDYPEEVFLLRHVEETLKKFDMLCTFNGATFDVPLLEGRFLMNRMNPGCLNLPHLDLLHLCRRLWKLRLGKCNLGRLEEVILGKPREEDLPGSEVPRRVFDYLKTGNAALLDDILKHNVQDIATLCVLLNHMAYLYLHPEEISFGEDVYSMGRALEKLEHTEKARRCYRLVRCGRAGEKAAEALAVSYRRGGDRAEAAGIWREMIRRRQGGVRPYVELAKWEEHDRRNPEAALELTEQAMALLAESRLREDDAVQEMKNALQYRHDRLMRKMRGRRNNGTDDRDQGEQGIPSAAEGAEGGGRPPV